MTAVSDAYRTLEQRIKNSECGVCHNPNITVAYRNGEYTIYCLKCNTSWPPMERMKRVDELARSDEGEKMSTQLEQYRRAGLPTTMTVKELRRLLPPTKATDQEVEAFMLYCRSAQLNPFLKEVYLVKYKETDPASIVLGIETHMKRAGRNKAFRGLASGVIVLRKGEEVRIEGKVLHPGDVLLGGWATVYHAQRQVPYTATASLEEYDTGMFLWRNKKATMIETTAIRHALKRYFPEDVEALEDSELSVEMVDSMPALESLPSGETVDTETGEIIDTPLSNMDTPLSKQGSTPPKSYGLGHLKAFMVWSKNAHGFTSQEALCQALGVEQLADIPTLYTTFDDAAAYLDKRAAEMDMERDAKELFQ